ncbi:hypothetical protein ACFFJN_10190 [Erwinia mallotivora]|uniref:hypothetical protein n=1 Tax=Erwinia mallotivora TaxID=69222 RepID=UPI0035E52E74
MFSANGTSTNLKPDEVRDTYRTGVRRRAFKVNATALHMAGAALEMVPNIYGMAVGGARYGALINAAAPGAQISGDATNITAGRFVVSEDENDTAAERSTV